MGLRFRKSISLLPGVRLNLSKSGVGVSAGVPGLRGSINTSGRVTGTVGIPGTGVSYVKTKTIGKKSKDSKSKDSKKSSTTKDSGKKALTKESSASDKNSERKELSSGRQHRSVQIDANTLKSIHNASDEKIDWKKISESESAESMGCNEDAWEYLRDAAPGVLKGDIDTYLQVISDVNPLDDLLNFGSDFQFGTDDPSKMEVEFVINEDALENASQTLTDREYNSLLQDFVCSMSLRIARDVFALLPVNETVVHVVLSDVTVFSVVFDSATFSKINFSYIDPSNTATKFRNNMIFDLKSGFSAVNRL